MNPDPEHMRNIAKARWERTPPEKRSADARAGFLAASVTHIENNAADLTDAQVERLILALAESPERD